MRLFIPFSILTVSCIFSCSEKIELNIPAAEPQIVVFGVLNPDSLIQVRLSETLPMLGTGAYAYIDNAEMELRADGYFVEHLQYVDSGLYRSSIRAQEGVNYEIFVDVQGFDRIHASALVPEPQYLSDGHVNPDVYYNHQIPGYDSEADIFFYDPPKEENYYQVSFYSYDFAGYGVDTVTNTVIVTDSTWHYTEINYMHSKDPVIENEGDLQYYYVGAIRSLVFSDQLINGPSTVSFLVRFSGVYNQKPVAIIRHINRDYYKFHKSLVRQVFNADIGRFNAINMFLVNNPNDLYSNIENGIGIFTAYAETHFELQVTE